MKLMQQEARIRIQLCALFSQLHHHTDALEQAKMSTRLIHGLVKDLLALCNYYTKKKFIQDKTASYTFAKDNENPDKSCLSSNNSHSQFSDKQLHRILWLGVPTNPEERQQSLSPYRQAVVHNYAEEDLSLIERTAQRVKPIIEALKDHLVQEKKVDELKSKTKDTSLVEEEDHDSQCSQEQPEKDKRSKTKKKIEPDMRIVLGYLNQLEMISNLNIGNIMQIQPVRIEELLSIPRNETEFNRTSFIEKISLL